jgi:hypothetical protein
MNHFVFVILKKQIEKHNCSIRNKKLEKYSDQSIIKRNSLIPINLSTFFLDYCVLRATIKYNPLYSKNEEIGNPTVIHREWNEIRTTKQLRLQVASWIQDKSEN